MEFLSGIVQRRLRSAPFFLVLIIATAITLVPIVWVFASALKSNKEIRENPLALPGELRIQNYIDAWFGASFDQYFFNSIFITVTSVAIVLFLSSLAAYSFAKMRFRGNQTIFFVFLIGMAFPLSAKLGPLLSLMYELNLANSRIGLILVYVAGSLPFAILDAARVSSRASRRSWKTPPHWTAAAVSNSIGAFCCRSPSRLLWRWESSSSWVPGTNSSRRCC